MPVLLALAACRPPQPALPPPPPLSLSLQPAEATVTAGHDLQFGHRITSGSGTGVDWRVLEPGGGTVDALGRYQAPGRAGVFTVEARPQADPARAVRARVTVVPAPVGTISAPSTVAPEATGLRAGVPVQPGCRFAWTLTGGTLLSGADTDTVTFLAGEGPSLVLACRITNAAGDSLRSSVEIPVARPLALHIGPAKATLTVGQSMRFGYTLEGNGGSEVIWSVDSPGGGTVDPAGTYHAPARPGTYTLQVASRVHPEATDRAQVRVVAAPKAGITAPDAVKAGAAGLVARVPEQPGARYAWELQGGTATAGTQGPVLTFAAGDGPTLTLRCTVTNAAGDTASGTLQIPVTR
ncbi:hypothetical protein GETHPA_28220 [Geothrix rubra]|uniref:Ig-like domain-containing protein n=2 Tax=Geothrix rubra TaxID=2927977 RepID=A0ABQ5Q8Y0_9BACT|nr:hypothetical protein GETHPA_28220 [Geothrix rubra]